MIKNEILIDKPIVSVTTKKHSTQLEQSVFGVRVVVCVARLFGSIDFVFDRPRLFHSRTHYTHTHTSWSSSSAQSYRHPSLMNPQLPVPTTAAIAACCAAFFASLIARDASRLACHRSVLAAATAYTYDKVWETARREWERRRATRPMAHARNSRRPLVPIRRAHHASPLHYPPMYAESPISPQHSTKNNPLHLWQQQNLIFKNKTLFQ